MTMTWGKGSPGDYILPSNGHKILLRFWHPLEPLFDHISATKSFFCFLLTVVSSVKLMNLSMVARLLSGIM